ATTTPVPAAEQPRDEPVPAGPEPAAPGPVAPVDLPPLTPPRVEPARPVAPRAPISVPADARSTAEQRARVRAALGTRYDVAGRAVARLLAERPGLRGAHGNALAAELAVVRIFALDPAGDHDLDFHTCLVSGLRALPTARSVVLRGLPPGHGYAAGQVLSPRVPVSAVAASPDRRVPGVEALIWTTTARRLDGLLDADRRDEVLLPAHTRLRVLAVEDGGRRVLLAEEGTAEEQALTRLRAAAAARPAVPDPTTDSPTHGAGGGSPWFGDLPTA
ncbi:hypothetical protein NUG22_37185, partial [Saccharothrix longispora]|nr:hypothetical protein [Saccharothrix longispora]